MTTQTFLRRYGTDIPPGVFNRRAQSREASRGPGEVPSALRDAVCGDLVLCPAGAVGADIFVGTVAGAPFSRSRADLTYRDPLPPSRAPHG